MFNEPGLSWPWHLQAWIVAGGSRGRGCESGWSVDCSTVSQPALKYFWSEKSSSSRLAWPAWPNVGKYIPESKAPWEQKLVSLLAVQHLLATSWQALTRRVVEVINDLEPQPCSKSFLAVASAKRRHCCMSPLWHCDPQAHTSHCGHSLSSSAEGGGPWLGMRNTSKCNRVVFPRVTYRGFRWGKVNKDREEVVRELLAKWLRMLQREKACGMPELWSIFNFVLQRLFSCRTFAYICYTAAYSITLSALGAGHWRGYSSADSELGCVLRPAVEIWITEICITGHLNNLEHVDRPSASSVLNISKVLTNSETGTMDQVTWTVTWHCQYGSVYEGRFVLRFWTTQGTNAVCVCVCPFLCQLRSLIS